MTDYSQFKEIDDLLKANEVYFCSKHSKFKKRITSVELFSALLDKEISFWSQFTNKGYQNSLVQEYNFYTGLKHEYDSYFNQFKNGSYNAQQILSLISGFDQRADKAFFSELPSTKFIISQYSKGVDFGEAAVLYYKGSNLPNNSSHNFFNGLIEAFLDAKKPNYLVNSKAIQESFEDILEAMNTSYDIMFREHELKIGDLQRQKVLLDVNISDLDSTNEKWKSAHSKDLEDQKELWDNDLKTTKNDFSDQMEQLKKTYTEYIKLKQPAQEWDDLSKDYKKQGKYWFIAAIGTTVLFIWFLQGILYNLPPVIENLNFGVSTFDGIRGSLLLTLIVSLGVYLIRLFVKMGLSAYHLSRDANERKYLTHVYLSLINENAIETQERSIVLSALFSRSDTGLLKGDSSPTAPDIGAIASLAKTFK